MSTPPLVLAHGFTQTSRSWGRFLDLLGDDRPLVTVDLPGHGGAPVAQDLLHAAHRLGAAGGWGDYLGYSLGGRVALHLALAQPELVTSLILIGVHPGIEDPIERIERQASDDELAQRLEQIGVPAFLDEWLAQPLFATLPPSADQRESREANAAAALAETLRRLSTGRQAPVWSRLPSLSMPVLLLAGERDDKYVRIGREAAASIGALARFEVIAGAGHAVHLEQPEATAEVVRDFLDRNGSGH